MTPDIIAEWAMTSIAIVMVIGVTALVTFGIIIGIQVVKSHR